MATAIVHMHYHFALLNVLRFPSIIKENGAQELTAEVEVHVMVARVGEARIGGLAAVGDVEVGPCDAMDV